MIPDDAQAIHQQQQQLLLNDHGDLLRMFYIVTSISLFSAMIPSIVSLLLNIIVRDGQMETSLKRQVSDLKEELGSISMTDEFAKYSKIQRKLMKISDELKNKNNRQFLYQTKTRIILYGVFYIVSAVMFTFINWNYYHKPIMFFSSENLFFPIGPILAFPTGQTNCLSITAWFFISGYVFRMFVNKFLSN